MYRKWKGVAALGMAALIGCLMPMGTMMAAEDNPEVVQEVVAGFEAAAADNDEAILDDNEDVSVEEDADTDENVDDEINADDESAEDEVNADDENAEDEVNADDVIADDEVGSDNDGNDGIAVMSEVEAGDVEVQASSDAPVIDIKVNGQNCTYDLSGNIDYKYVKELKFELSASQDSKAITFCYFIDKTPGDKAKEDIQWSGKCGPEGVTENYSTNGAYVVYVKAEADGQTVYARSGGIVLDSVAPAVTGITNGGTCQEGTIFHVEDSNLESVTVNEQSVTLTSDGNYQVTEAGKSCKIIAKDKAGNETTCNVTVTARDLETNGSISVNGTYSLKADTPYQLGEGQWQVEGDSTIYSGGNEFYIGTDSNYRFTKR